MSTSLFFILLCLFSMHANSEARYIGLGRGRTMSPQSNKGWFLVVEKLRLGMDSKGSVLVKQDVDLVGEQKSTLVGAVASSGANTKGIMGYAGSEIFESSSSSSAHHHMGLHKDKARTTINKESRRRKLYAKENRQATYKVQDDAAGVVLEDYNPPHRTPPIHNRRT